MSLVLWLLVRQKKQFEAFAIYRHTAEQKAKTQKEIVDSGDLFFSFLCSDADILCTVL